ncbi:MAG TPA: NYN domain-containing protein [Azonexus sp.]
MAASDTASMALFCDFENVALGVRDAQYEKFDIRPVLERLLAKGSIVVKKAYCDWERYKGFKSAMHEANFELIEIPHVRQSGKNSADIRLVVDALDLCYTKSHVDTFVIISGDSDFSPLVSKLRENAKRVIGVGVKQSCSDLLVANCDEFIYYDDLVRERNGGRRESREAAPRRTPEEERNRGEKLEARKAKAVELAAATFADLIADRGDTERIWASVLKEVIKRRNPGFNETYFGFRSFGNLLEEAANRGLLGFGRDDKSGAYVTRATPRPAPIDEGVSEAPAPAGDAPDSPGEPVSVDVPGEAKIAVTGETETSVASRRRSGGRRSRKDRLPADSASASDAAPVEMPSVAVDVPVAATVEEAQPAKSRRGGRRPKPEVVTASVEGVVPSEVPVAAPDAGKPAAKRARTPRSRKPKTGTAVKE